MTSEIDWSRTPFSADERNQTFLSRRGKSFLTVSAISGLDDLADGRAFALLDFDRDGFTDLVTSSVEFPTFRLFHNRIGEVTPANFIAVRLVGGSRASRTSSSWSNRDGVGAKVHLNHEDGTVQTRERHLGEGLSAQNSATLLFGLAARQKVKSLTVQWPSGRVTELDQLAAGSLVTVFENPADTDGDKSFVSEPYAASPAISVASTYPSQPSMRCPIESKSRLTLYVSTATWCAACKSKLPVIDLLSQQFTRDELGIVAIPVDDTDTPEKLQAYQDQYQPSYHLLIDATEAQVSWMQSVLQQVLQEEALPSSVLVDSSGRILSVDWGLPSVSAIRRQLEAPAPQHDVWRTFELPQPASTSPLDELLKQLIQERP